VRKKATLVLEDGSAYKRFSFEAVLSLCQKIEGEG